MEHDKAGLFGPRELEAELGACRMKVRQRQKLLCGLMWPLWGVKKA
jgi:hypothetical protein